MKPGRAFEILVKKLLLSVGFTEILSDGLYIFDGPPGQMIQGLGQAHNADVLLTPPVQTPFYFPTRILIECKDHAKKIGLDIIRSALGLREDINHFEIVEKSVLAARRRLSRKASIQNYDRYQYQVAVASMSGFTTSAQEFAATHRIPLIAFDSLPFWNSFLKHIPHHYIIGNNRAHISDEDIIEEESIETFAEEIGRKIAVAITESGQLLFLYHLTDNKEVDFQNYYEMHWNTQHPYWYLSSGQNEYCFELPKKIKEIWLKNSFTNLDLKRNALDCKSNFLSNMVVYYKKYSMPQIKMISIDRYALEMAAEKL